MCVISPNTIKSKHLQRHLRTVNLFSCHPGKTDTAVSHRTPTSLTAGRTVSSYDRQLGLKMHCHSQWLNTKKNFISLFSDLSKNKGTLNLLLFLSTLVQYNVYKQKYSKYKENVFIYTMIVQKVLSITQIFDLLDTSQKVSPTQKLELFVFFFFSFIRSDSMLPQQKCSPMAFHSGSSL